MSHNKETSKPKPIYKITKARNLTIRSIDECKNNPHYTDKGYHELIIVRVKRKIVISTQLLQQPPMRLTIPIEPQADT